MKEQQHRITADYMKTSLIERSESH